MFNSDMIVSGMNEPYFGVITHDEFRKSNLTDENRKEFFNSGTAHVESVLKKIREHIGPAFMIKQALDFGCGVRRLVIPLSEITENVTGVDVSDSMLGEAGKNCES